MTGHEKLREIEVLCDRAFQGARGGSIRRSDAITKLTQFGASLGEATFIVEALVRQTSPWQKLIAIFTMVPGRGVIKLHPHRDHVVTVEAIPRSYGPNWFNVLSFVRFIESISKEEWNKLVENQSRGTGKLGGDVAANVVGVLAGVGPVASRPFPGPSASRKVAVEIADYETRTMSMNRAAFETLIIAVATVVECGGVSGAGREHRPAVKDSETWIRTFGGIP